MPYLLCYDFSQVNQLAYHMDTFHVDWSPTIDLGHNKIGGDKLRSAQERAERAISRKRKCEDEEFEAQMISMEEELREQESYIADDTGNNEVCHKETETEHKGDLPVDFFDERYFTNDDDKVSYYTGLPNQEILLSIFKLVIPLPGLKREYYWRLYLITLMKLRLNLGYPAGPSIPFRCIHKYTITEIPRNA